MGMPIAVSLAAALGQPPLLMMLVIGMAASVGFALPMATPPNAIVFGSGELTVRDMARAGLTLDVVGILVVVGVVLAIRSEEHTSELQSLMCISYAVFCLKNNIPAIPPIPPLPTT